jgi:hypothetical protein
MGHHVQYCCARHLGKLVLATVYGWTRKRLCQVAGRLECVEQVVALFMGASRTSTKNLTQINDDNQSIRDRCAFVAKSILKKVDRSILMAQVETRRSTRRAILER